MKAVALLSSGIDSPVAIYLMLRRGVEITPIHFRQDSIKEEKASEIVEILKRYGKLSDPIIVNFSEEHVPAFEKLRELGKIKYTCVLCKWLMLRKACRIGHEIGASAIITGDSLGQVASQTLDNLMVVSTASDLPILRPLIGLDKEEIVRIAKEIGTFEISSRKEPPCPFTPKYPVVRASLGEFQKILQDLI
ncbi:ThiI-related protein [Thermococcus kodakarensis KOD1]|uniref:ThiI-related protein n=1 Tax=Thermococcus kodakarensis (strain ATCC BAA-918 / JCM 12380 / KOD1) TaxID=69014 RepID=Q5JCY3_THEKO|nr:7-cyano-7-deazaguanine synthase [Thermococcus kodakarensis]WCN28437.1 7-cyano-7-deazaguanine synthase [Thermococcus kodakarensis]WCN30733.1 7-cyano-7-deazaguanine synthase [Thermococcus kodakarensis]BAD84555.1 ThiI-related protein [Thermococcus kodakarensis KOD1]